MIYKDETCPRCGNFVRGEHAPHGGREFAQGVGKKLAGQGVEYAASEIAAVDPFLGGAAYFFGKIAANRAIDNAADKIGDVFEFSCPRCGNYWRSSGRPRMPKEIIMKVKEEYMHMLKTGQPIGVSRVFTVIAIVCGILCLIFSMQMRSATMGFMDGMSKVFQFFMTFAAGILFMILAIVKHKKVSSMRREIERCEHQDLDEFKETHRNLFSDYPQYD